LLLRKKYRLNYSSHLAVAKNLISFYDPAQSFNQYLKKYFSQHKKYGSRDRKLISALCYDFFRLGFAFRDHSYEERILIAFFLCEDKQSQLLASLKPGWNEMISAPLDQKLAAQNWEAIVDNIFPFKEELTEQIDTRKFAISFLHQPKLFVRIRPGFKTRVLQKLELNNINCEIISENCISLINSSKIDTIIELDKEAVVQDYNSQRVGEFIKTGIENFASEISVWDCCAASGGKSIMSYDINPSISLAVSDKRKSILENLKQRFEKAGIKNYTSFTADLSTENNKSTFKKFDLVIADVPCTGSGTWSRTPEQLYYFDKKEIKRYSDLQKKIVQNIVGNLKQGGHLLYVTCSVFKHENEEVINFITEQTNLNLIKVEYFNGYEMQADTLFAALLTKR
jgi:16S rRNA (cytosine967-C5)-methyltransferase